MAYAILFQPGARRELTRLERRDQRRVLAAIESLGGNPRPPGCAKLAGFNDVWRVRVGTFRVIYRVADRILTVEVIRVAHRRDVYRGL